MKISSPKRKRKGYSKAISILLGTFITNFRFDPHEPNTLQLPSDSSARAIPTHGEIDPDLEWNGKAAVADFTIDGNAFTIRKEATGLVLLSGGDAGRELARVDEKTEFRGGAKLLSAIGDFLGVSGRKTPDKI